MHDLSSARSLIDDLRRQLAEKEGEIAGLRAKIAILTSCPLNVAETPEEQAADGRRCGRPSHLPYNGTFWCDEHAEQIAEGQERLATAAQAEEEAQARAEKAESELTSTRAALAKAEQERDETRTLAEDRGIFCDLELQTRLKAEARASTLEKQIATLTDQLAAAQKQLPGRVEGPTLCGATISGKEIPREEHVCGLPKGHSGFHCDGGSCAEWSDATTEAAQEKKP